MAKAPILPDDMETSRQLPPYFQEALGWLTELIAIPSLSRQEDEAATWMAGILDSQGMAPQRAGNNVWSLSSPWKSSRPTLLLNSHLDTVRPVDGWTVNPWTPLKTSRSLTGLGSNDAGASLICLMCTFLRSRELTDLPVNLVFAATAEEEISGEGGIESLLPLLPPIDMAIVGEPTMMQMAVAEKGLLVVDAEAHGVAGHAARGEGRNAILEAVKDIRHLEALPFHRESKLLGPVRVTVTQIEAGTQHNVIPDHCRYVLDIRTNEQYTNQEVFALLENELKASLKARSFRLNASSIPQEHPLVQAGLSLGLSSYGSPTLSDQALMPFPSLKIGVGDSARSHTADEYVLLEELASGLEGYFALLHALKIADLSS